LRFTISWQMPMTRLRWMVKRSSKKKICGAL